MVSAVMYSWEGVQVVMQKAALVRVFVWKLRRADVLRTEYHDKNWKNTANSWMLAFLC